MPKDGYAKMFEKMLEHPNIDIKLNTDYKDILDKLEFDKMIYTGPIDSFFDYKFGKLPYRSLKFEWENHKIERYQEAAVVNYVGSKHAFTRITEYKYLTGQENYRTTISREYSQQKGDPFYPIPTEKNRKQYLLYKKETEKLKNTFFYGRLAEYEYYNMDAVVGRMLKEVEKLYG